jgi:glycosyltransferase involved in cell wall biosynthesis
MRAVAPVELTIVVPVFNRDETLRRAITSIVSRSDKVAVVIVDDGSAPRFAAVADDVATVAGSPLVQVVHQTNRGPAAARNRGLHIVRTRFVMFLDSDDEIEDAAIAALDRWVIPREDVGLVCGAIRVVYPGGAARIDYPAAPPGAPWAKLPGGLAAGFVVRTDIARAVGGYDETLRFGENTDFILRLAEECRRRSLQVISTNDVFSTYYASCDNRRYDGRRLDAAIHLLRRGRFDLELPSERAKLHGIAAVNAGRVGRYPLSVKHAALAVVTEPRNPRHVVRLVVSLGGPLARRRWLRT